MFITLESYSPASSLLIRPKKRLGQHFLVDRAVLQKVVRAADLRDSDVVLEIGAGTGVLTRRLVGQVSRLVAVELDRSLAEGLRASFGPLGVRVVEGDARRLSLEELFDGEPPSNYKLLGNLPYYAATHILQRFLEHSHPPLLSVVMLQREVADSMVAGPGDASLLSVATQVLARPKIVALVHPTAFKPPPKVDSSIVKLERRDDSSVAVGERQAFFRLVQAGFRAPRKRLRNSLALGLGVAPAQAESLCHRAEVDPSLRPQALSIDEWLALYRCLEDGF